MYHFVINSHAKSKLGHKIWDDIERYLIENNFEYKKYFTSEAGSAARFASEITREKDEFPTIVVLGGDGTLNEVLNGIRNIEQVTLGYIPIGSSNDFGRGMNITRDYLSELKKIINPKKFIQLDYGVATYGGESKRFLVSSGIGFDAAVCYEVNHSPLKKLLNHLRLGKFTYGLVAIKQLAGIPYIKGTITLDNNEVKFYDKIFFSAIHVQKYEGGGYMFCPKADPTDGYLDICVAEKISKIRALTMLPGAKKGNHVKCRGIHVFRCKKAVFQMERKQFVHIDGETTEHSKSKEVLFETSPDKIRFIAG
ncbi:diacylglycerol/lipid kinase family protein [Anaerosporobacter sp.]